MLAASCEESSRCLLRIPANLIDRSGGLEQPSSWQLLMILSELLRATGDQLSPRARSDGNDLSAVAPPSASCWKQSPAARELTNGKAQDRI